MPDRKLDALRAVWLGSHLLDEPEGAAAHVAGEALGAATHAHLLQIGDRLAAVSAVLAQRYYRRAAAAWTALGADGFAQWVALGEQLASSEPSCRDGAMAYFALAPSAFGREGLRTAAAWCALGRELSATSNKLAATFFRSTGSLLRRADGLARLRTWVEIGRELYGQQGWQGEFLAQAYFAAAPQPVVILDPTVYRLWAGAGAALYPTVKERDFFGHLPRALRGWDPDAQADLLRTVIVLAAPAVKDAAALYRELPESLATLAAPLRAGVLRALRQTGKRLANVAADIAPVAGPLVLQVPEAQRLDALAQLDRVAAACPSATVAALRALPRVYEEAAPAMVREWFDAGLRLARDNPDAGMAYFALESRTSLKVLRATSIAATLEEVQGLLRKYVQMLSGETATLRSLDTIRLRPPLEECPAENEIALPLRIDWLATHEDNQRLYRFIAAQLAGRREFGTYDFVPPDGAPSDEVPPGGALFQYVSDPEKPEALEELFLLAEGVRIHHRLCAEYRGLAAEGRWVADRLLERWAAQPAPPRGGRLDAVLCLALRGAPPATLPRWLDEPGARLIATCVAPLAEPQATVRDSLQVAESLAGALAAAEPAYLTSDRDLDGFALDQITGDALLDMYGDDEGPPVPSGEAPRTESAPSNGERLADDERMPLQLSPDEMEGAGGAVPMSPEELKRLLDSGAKLKITQAAGEDVDGIGLFITDLVGKLPSEQIDELRNLVGDPESGARRARRRLPEEYSDGSFFAYDEWDYHIDDYRSAWCRLYELNIDGDSGEFFTQALGDYARLIPEVRRQFQRVRPEMYRTVRGLEDGEDFDLNAAIAARVDRRAGVAPSSRVYVARKREERDVATLFLVDMSASTDEPFQTNGGASRSPGRARRIIDVTKETLVIMAEALEEIGDAYAIYGFSGHGRERVEMYRVKSFAEALTTTVKGRLGGIEPKRSTRMGTALRHSVEKLSAVSSRVKHLFLLSDGFPQDYDYGQDRRSNVYGIRDTAAALREAEAAGVTPFCITVDKAGHDYLRQMCDESRYMVIEDITALPRELPKIYQRVVRA
ncbi:MAG TPA: VWA domain-containing protein [Candidatus Dormibacteraeota bacterium]|nr:VWA domain-containing protein [Candidatus Dormibacteraeota bacterium]